MVLRSAKKRGSPSKAPVPIVKKTKDALPSLGEAEAKVYDLTASLTDAQARARACEIARQMAFDDLVDDPSPATQQENENANQVAADAYRALVRLSAAVDDALCVVDEILKLAQ